MFEMANPVTGLDTVAMLCPYQIKVSWDPVTHPDFAGIEVVWWCIGEDEVGGGGLRDVRYRTWYSIDAAPGKAYIVAVRAHYMEGFYWPSLWTHTVVEVPQIEEKPQYTDLGQVTVIDTPRGPAILVDELREVYDQREA